MIQMKAVEWNQSEKCNETNKNSKMKQIRTVG